MSAPVPDWLQRQAELRGDRVAVVLPESGERVSYRSLVDGVARVAGGLAGLGVGAGDRVAVLALNGLPILELLFACARLRAILVPLNYRLSEPELLWVAASAQPAAVCCEQPFGTQAQAIARATGALPVAINEAEAGETDYRALRQSDPLPPKSMNMEEPWCILYTGGTTGRPKGAVLTHGSILWNAVNTNLSWSLREDDVAPVFTPMFHTGGLNVFTLPLLLQGGTLVLPRRFEPEQALRCIVEERATLLFMVPTMYQMLADCAGFEDTDLSAVRWAISGGAPCPDRLYDIFSRKLRVFKQGYGLTEVGPNNFATPDEDAGRKRGSVGRPTLFLRARVVDPSGRDLPPGEVGELLLSSPAVCAGYWRNPEDTAAAQDGEWFRTGDLVQCDDEGYYYVVDRKRDLIITGGENVYPAEVEEVLYGHPSVGQAAVVGVPDLLWGETVVAVVAARPGLAVSEAELEAPCRARLAGYKVPRRFEVWPALPNSAAGKIVRAEVRRQLAVASQRPASAADDPSQSIGGSL
jgi:fatty-acyl-CoA synthase